MNRVGCYMSTCCGTDHCYELIFANELSEDMIQFLTRFDHHQFLNDTSPEYTKIFFDPNNPVTQRDITLEEYETYTYKVSFVEC